jgi:hypothetical protein
VGLYKVKIVVSALVIGLVFVVGMRYGAFRIKSHLGDLMKGAKLNVPTISQLLEWQEILPQLKTDEATKRVLWNYQLRQAGTVCVKCH